MMLSKTVYTKIIVKNCHQQDLSVSIYILGEKFN